VRASVLKLFEQLRFAERSEQDLRITCPTKRPDRWMPFLMGRQIWLAPFAGFTRFLTAVDTPGRSVA
jgi:hypothetical protein